ncbi:hypothetical protein SEVIR_4G170327v4 [Setaria viridis]
MLAQVGVDGAVLELYACGAGGAVDDAASAAADGAGRAAWTSGAGSRVAGAGAGKTPTNGTMRSPRLKLMVSVLKSQVMGPNDASHGVPRMTSVSPSRVEM